MLNERSEKLERKLALDTVRSAIKSAYNGGDRKYYEDTAEIPQLRFDGVE